MIKQKITKQMAQTFKAVIKQKITKQIKYKDMKTQIVKRVTKPIIEYKVGQNISFSYEVPLQNIGWTTEIEEGIIQKVNRVTIMVLDSIGNIWKVNKEDILNK